jgi:hypothetical protein
MESMFEDTFSQEKNIYNVKVDFTNAKFVNEINEDVINMKKMFRFFC